MPGRNFSSDSYRYGFNGMEKDDEVKGSGNSVNYNYRMHDPRLGRFLSIDPLSKSFPFYSPYQFAGNMPITAIDLDGREDLDYRVVSIDKLGNAIVEIQVAQNTKSRGNEGVLLLHSLTSGATVRSSGQSNLDAVLGLNKTESRGTLHPNIKEQHHHGGGNLTTGVPIYYLKLSKDDLLNNNVTVVGLGTESSHIGTNADVSYTNDVVIRSVFILSVPPVIPIGISSTVTTSFPDVPGFVEGDFQMRVFDSVNEAVSNANQPTDLITKIDVSYPQLPHFKNQIQGLSDQIQSNFPNAEINFIETPNTVSVSALVTGTPVQNLSVGQ